MQRFAGALVLGLASIAAPQTARAEQPCVIELFTSQGCSSCPKADALLTRMAETGKVIALSLPVDYWDYIGWKDTLAMPAFSKRQKAYAQARGDGHIYTPQAVINGQRHVVGSKEEDINEACAGTKGTPAPAVTLNQSGDILRVEVGAAPANGPRAGLVWLMQVASKRVVEIKRGENSGRTAHYTNVVRGFVKLGEWDGSPKIFEATPEQLRDSEFDSWVVLVQSGSYKAPGAILSAFRSQQR